MPFDIRYAPPKLRVRTELKSADQSVPAPVGGWNARDALTMMPPTDAIYMDNWFPDTGYVAMRRGYTPFCSTGNLLTPIGYLHEHIGTNRTLIAACNGIIYDVSSGSAAALKTGLTSDRWYGNEFKGYTILCNASDVPQLYDGSTVTASSFSGVGLTTTNLAGSVSFKERLWFWESNSQDIWYGDLEAIAGTLTKFPLSMVGTKGGIVVGMGTWSVDGGAGPEDELCIFLSSGQVIIYGGTDPTDAETFSIKGIYSIGEPVHARAIAKFGADLCVVTRDGYQPLSRVLKSATSDYAVGISDKIRDAASEAVRLYFGNFGWQFCAYPRGHYVFVNVPVTDTTYYQHVMNTATGSWARFVGQNATCWSLFNGSLYFGGTDGTVYLADTGTDDNGNEVVADARQAWNSYGSAGNLKRFGGVMFRLGGISTITYGYQLSYDFKIITQAQSGVTVSYPGVAWDTVLWDTSHWGYTGTLSGPLITATQNLAQGTAQIQGPVWNETPWNQAYWSQENTVGGGWKSAAGIGKWESTRLRVSSNTQRVTWFTTDYMMSKGGLV